MKTRILLLTTAAALVIGAMAFAGTETEKNSPETELDRLQKKITALELRVKTLEQRLEKSAPKIYVPQIGPGIQTPPPGDSGSQSRDRSVRSIIPSPDGNAQHPKIWGEGEINGWKYYLIPCANGVGDSPQASPQKVAAPK